MTGCPFTLDPDGVRDPYPRYESLRAGGRAVFVPELDAWAITSYEDIQTVLRQPGLGSSRTPTGPHVGSVIATAVARVRSEGGLPPRVERYLAAPPDPTLFTIDPPDHTRQRRAVARLFSTAQVGQWETIARAVATSTVATMAGSPGGAVDLSTDFAAPIALGITCRIVGLPAHDEARLQRWADDVVTVIGDPSPTDAAVIAMLDARAEMFEVFADLIDERRRTPADDLATAVATLDAELSESERIGLLINFHVAGTESTAKLMINAAVALAGDPELWQRLDHDRTRVSAFVEEVLRLEPPSQGMYRYLTRPLELGDVTIPADAHVYLVYAAGNRDPVQFAEPLTLDPTRANAARHLSFGMGTHLCLGAPVARMEARVAVDALLDTFTGIEVEDAPFEYLASFLLHGPTSVRATVRPR